MFCSNCGTSIEKGSTFCPHCGQKLSVNIDDKIVETGNNSIVSIIVMSVIAVVLAILGIVLHSAADVAEIGESVYGASIGLGVVPLILSVLIVKKTKKLLPNDKSKSMQTIYAISIIVFILSAIAAVLGIGVVLAANKIQMFFPLIAACGVVAFILFKNNKK